MAIETPPNAVDRLEEGDESQLVRTLIQLHGAEAVRVARENARSAALAGQLAQARRWLRLVGLIQRAPAGPF